MSERDDIKQKGIAITLDKERHMVFDWNAFEELEDKYGSVTEAMNSLVKDKKQIKSAKYLLYLGLKHEDENITLKKVGSIVNAYNADGLMVKIMQAINGALPEAEKNEQSKETEEK